MDWLNNLKDDEYNDTYNNIIIINLKELYNIEEELYEKGEYLPVYICLYAHKDYTQYLKQEHKYSKDIEIKINNSRRYTFKEIINEFLTWINKHPKYNKLLDKKQYHYLKKELKKIDSEYGRIIK